MTCTSFLIQLADRGRVLVLQDGRLEFEGPEELLKPALRRYVDQHREALVAELRSREFQPRTTCVVCSAPTRNGFHFCESCDPFGEAAG